jgi:hypothetical protein
MAATLLPALITGGAGLLAANQTSSAIQSASDQSQAGRERAIGIAQQNATTNKGIIDAAGSASQSYLQGGFQGATNTLQPLVTMGDNALGYYQNATGLNGEAARNAYVQQLMARPEYAAARDRTTQEVQQRYGNKLGSGAFARSLQQRDREYAEQGIDRDLGRVRPLVSDGNRARTAMAGLSVDAGNAFSRNAWNTADRAVDNNNQITNAASGAAVANGLTQANATIAQSNAFQTAAQGIGNAFGQAAGSNASQQYLRNLFS